MPTQRNLSPEAIRFRSQLTRRSFDKSQARSLARLTYQKGLLSIKPSARHRKHQLVELIINAFEKDSEQVRTLYNAVRLGKFEQATNQPKDETTNREIRELASKLERLESSLTEVKNSQGEVDVEDLVRKTVLEKVDRYRPVEVVVPKKARKKMKDVLPEEFERILKLATQRINVLMVGPAGCGKTFLGGKVAEALNLPFGSISCSAGMSESQLAGWLLPTGTGGKFEYKASTFVELYEKGGVFLFDEVDAADPNTFTFINSAIANDHFHLPQRFGKSMVKKHPDFICLAAANTFGHGADMMYVGRNQLDAATLDRFRVGLVSLDYSPIVEEALIDHDILRWGREIRRGIAQHGLRRVMSTRCMLDLTKMKEAYGWDREDWEKSYFMDWESDEMRRVQQCNS